MFHLTPRTQEQEHWLAEVGSALAEAERLTGQLSLFSRRDDGTLASLQAQIMILREQVEWLRRKEPGDMRREYHPDWMKFSVWTSVP